MDLLKFKHILIILICVHFIGAVNLTDKANSYGYLIDTHNIITEDGYILTLHRLFHKKCNVNNTNLQPVLLMHGLFGSAEHFLLTGANRNLGFLLVKNGYDVWLGNARSVSYSRGHIKLNPDAGKEFWDFDLYALGVYDMSAIINHILSVTGYKKIQFVGHSIASALLIMLCSERPEYNEQISIFVGLSPCWYIHNLTHPLLANIANHMPTIEYIADTFGIYELAIEKTIFNLSGLYICKWPILRDICIRILFSLNGFNYDQLDKNDLTSLFTTGIEGISFKTFVHLKQLYLYGNFSNYDYGHEKNLEMYGSHKPPTFNLRNVLVPTALYYSENDWILPVENALRLADELPNVIDLHKVPHRFFTHLDFLWAKDLIPLLYRRVVKVMDTYKFNNNHTYCFLQN